MGTPTARGPRISLTLLIGLISVQFRCVFRVRSRLAHSSFQVLAKATVPDLPALPPCPVNAWITHKSWKVGVCQEFGVPSGPKNGGKVRVEARMTHPDGEPASSIPGRAAVTGGGWPCLGEPRRMWGFLSASQACHRFIHLSHAR